MYKTLFEEDVLWLKKKKSLKMTEQDYNCYKLNSLVSDPLVLYEQ